MTDTTAETGTPSNDPGDANADGAQVAAPDTTQNAAPAADAGDKQPDTKADGDKPAEPAVPESYDLKMPDGVQLDKAAADEFTAIAKELKLSAEDAQKVADVGAKMAQRQAEAHATMVESWVTAVKTDKEIGGDNLDQNLAVARKAMETFGTPELKELLNSTGLGNNPEVIRAFFKAGKAISEDGFVKAQAPAQSRDAASVLYGKQ